MATAAASASSATGSAAPAAQTGMPSIATEIGNTPPASCAWRRALSCSERAPQAACTIRPQLGSPPCSAAFTSGEAATARAATHAHARDALCALPVGHDHHGKLAQERIKRLGKSLGRLTLLPNGDAARPGCDQKDAVVGGELPVHADALKAARNRAPEQLRGDSGSKCGVRLDEAEHRRKAR